MFVFRQQVQDGGLMAYAARTPDLSRRAAFFVDRIVKGAKPADLPIEQPTHFELIINLKTAKVLDLDLPGTLLTQADEVIEYGTRLLQCICRLVAQLRKILRRNTISAFWGPADMAGARSKRRR
jgi:predicted ABC-class ATPase